MNKRLMIALLVIATLVVGYVIFFYVATAMKKQTPVDVETPVSKPTSMH